MLSQVNNGVRQDLIVTDSVAAINTNDTSSVSHGNPNMNHRKIGSHNFMNLGQ